MMRCSAQRLFLSGMTPMYNQPFKNQLRLLRWVLFGAAMLAILGAQTWFKSQHATAQQPAKLDPSAKAAADLAEADKAKAVTGAAAPATSANVAPEDKTLYELYWDGGVFMHPILLCSFVMILFAIERGLALRESKVIPPELVTSLGEMSGQGGFDPRKAYRLCQDYPSSLSNVVRAVLLKVGRPHAEVEQAAKESKDSEATKLYHNIRYIALTQTVAPMLGLLGTVQGIIMAFSQYGSASSAITNKFDKFAEGIYTALITTFAGLVVAIPAAVLCSFLEGRIVTLFHRIDDVLVNLLPQVERYEGTLRINREQLSSTAAAPSNKPAPAVVAPPPIVPMPSKS
jgi:biopolymer transport protein ExbB